MRAPLDRERDNLVTICRFRDTLSGSVLLSSSRGLAQPEYVGPLLDHFAEILVIKGRIATQVCFFNLKQLSCYMFYSRGTMPDLHFRVSASEAREGIPDFTSPRRTSETFPVGGGALN